MSVSKKPIEAFDSFDAFDVSDAFDALPGDGRGSAASVRLLAQPPMRAAKPPANGNGGREQAPERVEKDFIMAVLRRLTPFPFLRRDHLRRLVLATVMVALTACSAMKLGYQQGDRLAYWWIDNYVDVSASQDPPTRDAIARFFAWHRKAQLPEIVRLLRQVKSEVQQPVSVAAVARIQEDAQRLARVAFDRSTPDVADLLLTLTPDQSARMEKKFAEANAKYRKKYLRPEPSAREEARFDKVMDYARLVYGRFSSAQEATIRRAMVPVVQGAEARYAERVRRQQEWLALARQVQADHPPKVQVVDMLKRYGDHWQNPPTRERNVRYEANKEAGLALIVTIANLTTPEQKAHAVERFQAWIDDADSLMREGSANAAAAQPARGED